MGMEQAQHTPWEMIWKNMGIMAKVLREKWMDDKKRVFGETFTMYL